MKRLSGFIFPLILSIILTFSRSSCVLASDADVFSGEDTYNEETYEEEAYGEDTYEDEVYDEDVYEEDNYDEDIYEEETYDDDAYSGDYDDEVYDASADGEAVEEGGADDADSDGAGGEDSDGTDEDAESEDGADEADTGASVDLDETGWPVVPETTSGSVMMVEMNTGAQIYAKNEDTKRYPASTTKILTCLLALENCSLTDTVVFSANAVDLEEGASSIDAVEGEEMSLKDCLYGLMLPSGNDCAVAVAEHVAGSVEAFAEMMNERAEEIGCENTHFANPNGLYDANHYTTASDLCKIAQVCFNNSAFVEIVSHSTYTISETNKSEARVVENTNYMIAPDSAYYNEYVVGGKTGYLSESGRCLVTLAKKDGMSVVTVAMYCPNYNGVFDDTSELLDYVFNGFKVEILSESEDRFSYSSNAAKIKIDFSAEVLTPKNLTINDLDSRVKFTYDMDLDTFKEASETAGITSKDGRHLYAIIEYSYEGNYLGHINVVVNDNMQVAEASFINVTYVNAWWFALFVAVFVIIIILLAALIGSGPKRRRRRTRVIKTQDENGNPVPLNIKKVGGRPEIIQTENENGRLVRKSKSSGRGG